MGKFCYLSVGTWEKSINQFHIILQSNFSFSYLYFHSVITSELFAAGHIRVNTKNIDVYLGFQLISYIWKCFFLLKMMGFFSLASQLVKCSLQKHYGMFNANWTLVILLMQEIHGPNAVIS